MPYSKYSFNPKVYQKDTTVKVTSCPSPQKAKEESEQLNLELAVHQLMKKQEKGGERKKKTGALTYKNTEVSWSYNRCLL